MRIVAIATALALGVASPALAQMKAPGTPAATTDAAGEAKFKTADKTITGRSTALSSTPTGRCSRKSTPTRMARSLVRNSLRA
jgi:hypothetical protein